MSNSTDSKIHIVLSQANSFQDIVQPLVSDGALLHVLEDGKFENGNRFQGKFEIVFSILSLRVLKLRNCWRTIDRLLLIGWQAIPILAMMKIGLLKNAQKTLVTGCFVHGRVPRCIVNKILRILKSEDLGFIAFSRGEAENLINNVGIAPSSVYYHLWRQDLGGKVAPSDVIDGDYVFSGGYSNRDYELLLSSMRGLNSKLIIVASKLNEIKALDDDNEIMIYRDLNEFDFEKLLAQSKLVVIPLKDQGEACGQSVLLRVMRNGKPLIATRHESIENYLGVDYPGFVPACDEYALRSMIQRVLFDQMFRNDLALRISQADELLRKRESPAQEILRFLLE